MSRTTQSINSSWEFHLGDRTSAEEQWTRVCLPHGWNHRDLPEAGTLLAPIAEGGDAEFSGYGTGDGGAYYRGVGWYRKVLPSFHDHGAQRIYLRFEGANQDSVVYLNGQKIAEHRGGYTAFQVDLTPGLHVHEANLIEVCVSNANNPEVPPLGGDLGHFGGIYRPVWLIMTHDVHFDMQHFGSSGVSWETPEVSERHANLVLNARLVNDAPETHDVLWCTEVITPEEHVVAETQTRATLPPGGACIALSRSVLIENPMLWSPDHPVVYRLRHRILDAASLETLDEISSPLGFRFFSMDANRGFFLNGEHCFLQGVGRHQDFEDLGYAVPIETLVADTRTIRTMGANAMRSHYPLAEAIYATCDHIGLLAWVKIPVMDKIDGSSAFYNNARVMFAEMILQLKNHPSIILWGYACEILGDADWFWPKPQDPDRLQQTFRETFRFCTEFETLAKQLDPHRLTCNDFHSDPNPQWYSEAGLTRINDINGWNVYHGWYHRSLDDVRSWLEETRAYAPDRPYLLAEFGAGVDERIHAHDPTVFDMSPEYAELFHRTYRTVARELPWLAGVFIWTWSDFQRTSLGDSMKHINNKGLVTSRRHPKDVYYQYRAWWTQEPMVRIAGHAHPCIAGVASHEGTLTECVRVFSNQKQVELFANGSSLGTCATREGVATWQVPFLQGDNILQARSGDLLDGLVIQANLIPEDLRRQSHLSHTLCINIGQLRFSYHDSITGRIWLPDRKYGDGPYGHRNGRTFRSWPRAFAWDGIRDGVNRHIRGTEDQPLYQSFLVGLTDYQIDLPRGQYEVTLLFCEPFDAETRKRREIPHGADDEGTRIFDVLLNDRPVMKKMNLAEQYGERSAVTESFITDVRDGTGLRVGFRPIKGEPVLNGLAVRPL